MIREIQPDRRSFLSGAAACAGIVGLSGCTSATDAMENETVMPKPYEGKLGLQLYTVRDLFEADYAATLKALADIGYKECETAGYFDHNPADVKAVMDDLGLKSSCGHASYDRFTGEFERELEHAEIMGQKYVILPWINESLRNPDSYREIADLLNTHGELAKAAGKQVAYHNHEFEFLEIDGERGYDILLERTDPELVKMELDLFWAADAGQDAVAVMSKAPERFVACHIKDRAADGSMVAVGDGEIDFATLLPKAAEMGMQHFYVEHDNPDDALVSLGRSYTHLMA